MNFSLSRKEPNGDKQFFKKQKSSQSQITPVPTQKSRNEESLLKDTKKIRIQTEPPPKNQTLTSYYKMLFQNYQVIHNLNMNAA